MLILAWVVFPVVVAALGTGWGVLIEKAAGAKYHDTLLIPLGLAGVLVVAGLLTAFASTAPAATPVVAAGAGIGLIWGRPWRRFHVWPSLAAVGVTDVYFELFDATHMGIDYRYPLSLAYLAQRLS